jgi:hypothetical protein
MGSALVVDAVCENMFHRTLRFFCRESLRLSGGLARPSVQV